MKGLIATVSRTTLTSVESSVSRWVQLADGLGEAKKGCTALLEEVYAFVFDKLLLLMSASFSGNPPPCMMTHPTQTSDMSSAVAGISYSLIDVRDHRKH